MTIVEQLTAALQDRYRIERELGRGGMATVYLGHDLKHDRDVAIKVLHPDLGAALGGERFLSEIRTTAKLQHPHILPLLDSGAAGGLLYYVMPYVTGETLRARLDRERQLPIEDALRIAREVADALGAAHALGIIHRDIKPENILLQGGHALVADFGIALAVQSAGGQRMTQTGLSLGTPQYMSPEQAMGERTIDARSDIYALAAVTYEMLAGEPPFTGGTVQAIVAKLLTDPARPLTQLRKSVPLHVEAAVLAGLEKLPADRIASASAFGNALSDASFATRATTSGHALRSTPRMVPRNWLVAALAAIALLLLTALAAVFRPAAVPATARQQVVLWQNSLPNPLEPGARVVATQATIAPDGSSIVYSDSSVDHVRLMRKMRGDAEATLIAGTEGGISPFFSPDGAWIGYLTLDGKLKKVAASGGSSITLAEGTDREYRVGAWLDDGTIAFSDARAWISLVSSNGGVVKPAAIGHEGGNTVVAAMETLPGSRGVLLTICSGNCALESALYVYDRAADSMHLLVPQAAGGWYSPTGHLLYTSREGGLFAVAFDPKRFAISESAIPVLPDVEPTRFTLSSSGAALYTLPNASSTELVWVTPDGRATLVDSTWSGRFEYPAVSPSGSALAVSLRGSTTDLWIRKADGTRQKVIAKGVANWRPSWFPGGDSLAFISVTNPAEAVDDVTVYTVKADASGQAELLLRHSFGVWEAELSRDAQWLVFRTDEKNTDANIYARRLHGDTSIVPLAIQPGNTMQPALSPDGRWLAFTSYESGELGELVVASFPDMKSRQLVSRGGGNEPRWSRDGRTLYFKSGGKLVAVAVPTGPTFAPGNPRALFAVSGFRSARNRAQYDVAPDGRFLMIREVTALPRIVYAENWLAELTAKLKQ